MSHESTARDVLYSFLPEAHLIRTHNFESLFLKLEARRMGDVPMARLLELFGPGAWGPPCSDDVATYEETKYFDGLQVEGPTSARITAEDPVSKLSLELGKSTATMLHLFRMDGPEHLRRQLATAAKYMAGHAQEFRKAPLVVGATFSELGRVAMALGFRELHMTAIGDAYSQSLHARHEAFALSTTLIMCSDQWQLVCRRKNL